MSSLAETTRPRAESFVDKAEWGETGSHSGGGAPERKAVLRGESRPDLIRDEVLGEIFSDSARLRPDHPAIIDGASRTRPAVIPPSPMPRSRLARAPSPAASRIAESAPATSSDSGWRGDPTC